MICGIKHPDVYSRNSHDLGRVLLLGFCIRLLCITFGRLYSLGHVLLLDFCIVLFCIV